MSEITELSHEEVDVVSGGVIPIAVWIGVAIIGGGGLGILVGYYVNRK